MATRIRCSFCDYVMNAPETASTNTSRMEWTCLGCDSPIIVEASPSALGSALRAAPLQPGSTGTHSPTKPTTSGVTSSPRPSAVEVEVVPEPAPLPVEQPAAPPSRNTLPALGASPPAATSWSSHRSPPPPAPPRAPLPPRRTPPPPPPLRARPSSSPPPPFLEALGSKRARVSLSPLTPPPRTHASSLEARSVSGVQSLRAPAPHVDASSAAPSNPARLPPPAPRSEPTSNPDARPAPTQRSAQAPRWVYGALAAVTLASGGTGYLLHDASLLFVEARETRSTSPALASPPRLELATDEPTQVVEASYAPPAAEAPPTAFTASPESDSLVADAVKPQDEAPAQGALPSAKHTVDNRGTAPARIAAAPLATPQSAPAPVATPPSAPRAVEAVNASPALQKIPSVPAPTAATAGSPVARPAAPNGATPAVGVASRGGSTPPAPTPQVAAPSEEATAPSLPPFDKSAARLALDVAGARAQSCRQASDPAGSARIIVTFAPSGRVTTATVSGAPYAGTATGGCVATAFRGAAVPAFAGPAITVTKTVGLN